jgi:hypothetical protein
VPAVAVLQVDEALRRLVRPLLVGAVRRQPLVAPRSNASGRGTACGSRIAAAQATNTGVPLRIGTPPSAVSLAQRRRSVSQCGRSRSASSAYFLNISRLAA